ncbi:MAG: branched-chain amino acid ABC transporter permease [Desulfobacterales bacterium]|nr:branched-chain amino acid ABC transporter permease [Desulfobacterales bacterium]MBL7205160.1 branched-chain amino acid ABC transporter permease [Desulfobacteraceae bacterium]
MTTEKPYTAELSLSGPKKGRVLLELALIAACFLVMAIFVRVYWMVDFCIFCILVLSFDLLYGYMGRLTFGHVLYYGTGGYVASLVLVHLSPNPFLAIALGMASGTLIALVLGSIVVRLRDAPFALSNLAFNQIGFWLANAGLQNYTEGEDGLSSMAEPIGFLDFTSQPVAFGFMLVCLLLVFWLLRTFTLSPYGVMVRSIKENEERVKFLGYNTYFYKWLTFVLSSSLAAFAGTLYALYYGFVAPNLINPFGNIEIIFAVLIGGAGNLFGALVGGVVFKLMSNYLATAIPRWELLMGVLLLILVFRFKRGLTGYAIDLRLRISRRRAAEV